MSNQNGEKWERVVEPADPKSSVTADITERLKLPNGGYLYRVIVRVTGQPAVSVCFVPEVKKETR